MESGEGFKVVALAIEILEVFGVKVKRGDVKVQKKVNQTNLSVPDPSTEI